MRLRATRLLVALIGLLVAAVGAQAQKIHLVTGNGYAPFSDESLPKGGFATELVQHVVEEMGLEPAIRFLPWKRAIAATEIGQFVATFPYIRSAERERQFLLSDPLYEVQNRVFVRRDAAWSFERVEDLSGRTACNQLGSAHPRALQALIDSGSVKLESPRDLASCFKMMQIGRVDFVSINEFVAQAAMREAFGGSDGFKPVGPPVEKVGLYLLVPRQATGGAEFLMRFNHALAGLKRQPLWREMQERHFGRVASP